MGCKDLLRLDLLLGSIVFFDWLWFYLFLLAQFYPLWLLFLLYISLNLLFRLGFILIDELLILLLLLPCGMIKLAVLALATVASLGPELAWFFGLLLMHEGAVLLNAFTVRIVPADLAFLLSFHFIFEGIRFFDLMIWL